MTSNGLSIYTNTSIALPQQHSPQQMSNHNKRQSAKMKDGCRLLETVRSRILLLPTTVVFCVIRPPFPTRITRPAYSAVVGHQRVTGTKIGWVLPVEKALPGLIVSRESGKDCFCVCRVAQCYIGECVCACIVSNWIFSFTNTQMSTSRTTRNHLSYSFLALAPLWMGGILHSSNSSGIVCVFHVSKSNDAYNTTNTHTHHGKGIVRVRCVGVSVHYC